MIRALLLAALAPLSALASTSQEWRFRVLLDGRPVGEHVFRVEERAGERHIDSDARFTVKFLFVDAYTYRHQARERWQGECLLALDAHTDDNGRRQAVAGRRAGGGFTIAVGDAQARLPDCVMSFAYWNPALLRQPRLLNVQTGELQDVRVDALGEESIPVRGVTQTARRYALHAPDFRIDLWYAADRDWVQLESRTSGGRLLRYLIQ
jgi:hypothetical protein